MSRRVWAALLLGVGMVSGVLAAGNGMSGGGCAAALPAPAAVALDEAERANLLRMREEEKMARDLYLLFYERWGLTPFTNVADAEQQHMDRMLAHLTAQGLEDPAPGENGRFSDAAIQALYDRLAARGEERAEGALSAAAYVEEIDIQDLQQALVATADADQRLSYVNLMTGSYRHLQAFVRQLTRRGVAYTAQVLPQEQVSWILAGDFAPDGGTALTLDGGLSASCFIPLLIADDGRVGDGLVLGEGEGVELTVELLPESAHVGLDAELLAVAARGDALFQLDDTARWQPWNGALATLAPLRTSAPLGAAERYRLLDGTLAGYPGDYAVTVGYRLGDGSVVTSSAPLRFSVR
ncbi:DUF2202 domain-containing protein [Endothiovibrio diazotrophicus]